MSPTQATHRNHIIRASDIGLYVFCARAWRLKADGYESANHAEMAAGTEAHAAHGRQVAVSQYARRLSLVLFMLALIIAILMFASR
jgi:hypothetical protein